MGHMLYIIAVDYVKMVFLVALIGFFDILVSFKRFCYVWFCFCYDANEGTTKVYYGSCVVYICCGLCEDGFLVAFD